MFEARGKGWLALLTLLAFLGQGCREQKGAHNGKGLDAFDKSLNQVHRNTGALDQKPFLKGRDPDMQELVDIGGGGYSQLDQAYLVSSPANGHTSQSR